MTFRHWFLKPSRVAEITQRMPDGQCHFLDEIATTAGAGMGPDRFSGLLTQLLKERYEPWTRPMRKGEPIPIQGYADPSAQYGKDQKARERSWI